MRRLVGQRRHRHWLVALLTCLAFSVAPSLANADSLVYLKAGDVWIANPDGSDQRPVTTNGPYTGVSQADDGTIVAFSGTRFYRMDQSGNALGPPVESSAPEGQANDIHVSPDGRRIAFGFSTLCPGLVAKACSGSVFSWSDRFTPASEFGHVGQLTTPSWINNDTVAVSGQGNAWTHQVGGATTLWFGDPVINVFLRDVEVASAGDRVVAVRSNASSQGVQLYSLAGPPPTLPAEKCLVISATEKRSPTWSPDGQGLAWSEPDGIWIEQGLGDLSGDCAGAQAGRRLVLPGGSQPDWGPANVGPYQPKKPLEPAPLSRPSKPLEAAPLNPPSKRSDAPPPSGSQTRGSPLVASVLIDDRQALRTVLKRGLQLRMKISKPAVVAASLQLLDGRLARRLRQHGAFRVQKAFPKAGTWPLTVRLGRQAAQQLASSTKLRLRLDVRASDTAGLAKRRFTLTLTKRGLQRAQPS